MCICQLKQHFQDWGNLYQVILGAISVALVVWLWLKDRKKEIKIADLAVQTKVLKDLLDNNIVPYLQVIECHSIGATSNFRIEFINTGGPLYHLESGTPFLGNASFGFNPQFNIPTGVIKNAEFLWSTENHRDSIIFKFEDKLKRKFNQELKLIEGTAYFEISKEIIL